MKATLSILALSVCAAGAFQAGHVSPTRTSSALGSFLDGKGKRITIREDEDAAMYFDDGNGGRIPSEKPKKPEPKKPAPKKPGFKFPWDK